jgi:hypothetical protein
MTWYHGHRTIILDVPGPELHSIALFCVVKGGEEHTNYKSIRMFRSTSIMKDDDDELKNTDENPGVLQLITTLLLAPRVQYQDERCLLVALVRLEDLSKSSKAR